MCFDCSGEEVGFTLGTKIRWAVISSLDCFARLEQQTATFGFRITAAGYLLC